MGRATTPWSLPLSLLCFSAPLPPSSSPPPSPGTGKEVVVVGAGVAGLCTSARLQRAGFHVTVVEKNSREDAGGRLHELTVGPYRFETGPSLLLLPDVYRETFRDLGVDMDAHISIQKVEPSYGVRFSDGANLNLFTDRTKMEGPLEAIEAGSFAKYNRYLDVAQANLDFGLANMIEERLDLSSLPRFLSVMVEAWPLQGHHRYLSSLFTTQKLCSMLSFQDLYVGLTPYAAPAVFSLLQAIELNQGVYYPIGGFQQVARLLLQTAEKLGVRFLFDTEVDSIETAMDAAGNTVATGVHARTTANSHHHHLPADIVVSNVDAPFTNKYLIKPDNLRRPRDHDQRLFSSSVVSFCWALDRKVSSLEHHTVFLDEGNPRKAWEGVFNDNAFAGQCCNFYVHAPSRTDQGACPEGHDAIMVLVPAPVLGPDEETASQAEEALVSQAREAVLRRIEDYEGKGALRWVGLVPAAVVMLMVSIKASVLVGAGRVSNQRDHIVHEEVITPSQWRNRYSISRGAVFGLRHSLDQLSLLRPPFSRRDIGHLYYCGASNRPGNGVPLTMIGAKLLASKVIRENKQ